MSTDSSPPSGDENITPFNPQPLEPTIMGDSTPTAGATFRRADAAYRGTVDTYRGADLAASLLRRVFRHLPFSVVVRLWTGSSLAVGGAESQAADARFSLWFRNPQAVSALILGNDPLRLAEAYFRSELDIEGDLFAALRLRDHLEALRLPLGERVSALLMARKLRSLNKHAPREGADGTDALSRSSQTHGREVRGHSRDENRGAINFHYDVSNEFYRLWLDRAMVYSCAYFEDPDYSLDDAQQAKLEHICRKLLLKPGERLLDIGCGWGALVMHAARHHGVRAHGVTLSEKQLQVARLTIAEAGLQDQVTVELRDYRDLEGREVYDKVASVGMFEHVGLNNLPLYFSTVHRLLKSDGLFLNHGITHEQAGWDWSLSTEFINRYVFPDGQLDNISNIQRCMEDAQFEITDVEALRAHYALTLRAWVERLERRHARALEYVSEATYRVWRLYMSACALEFESGHLGVYQVLASKRGPRHAHVPLTRRHLYLRPAKDAAVAK
ncbi:MAG: class I SAM-dependent methyltransferase [Steroidobacteraceae bacterium]|jgi:cyclopropane-fatty-acyl-phospholipid synthase